MATDEIVVTDDDAAHRYEARIAGELAGFVTYQRSPGTIAFEHTDVDGRFEGRGVGSALVRHALGAAQQAGDAVLPHCPFVRSYIQRHADLAGLVPADRRGEFGL